MSLSPMAVVESLRIGTVDFVAPDEIKVLLDLEAPDSVALNSGSPRSFPRVNSYILIPSDQGYLVGQVEWITVERSQFPKRKGMQDFGLVDLPYPLRRMRVNPLGSLVRRDNAGEEERYEFRRGVESFPAVGDSVLLPTQRQLLSIVKSGEKRRVKIGVSPLAGNATVAVDPDRLFGRHLAVLGNTGSGKSCSVAGLIRWSLEAAKQEGEGQPNARFLILDPNGEYSKAFKGVSEVRVFAVDPGDGVGQLKVPLWFWNSTEWSAFTQASGKAQRPALQKALRQQRNPSGVVVESGRDALLRYLQGAYSNIRQEVANNAPFVTGSDRRYWGFMELLHAVYSSLQFLKVDVPDEAERIDALAEAVKELKDVKSKNARGYTKPFEYGDVAVVVQYFERAIQEMGGETDVEDPIHEDVPRPFSYDSFLTDLDFIATNSGNRQWFDSLLARIRALLSDTRMRTVCAESDEITLESWLTQYIGGNKAANGTVTVVDLSLVPAELVHVVATVIARMTLEALQRYRKLSPARSTLPTVLVMEEAHTFVKRYKEDAETHGPATVCCQMFEKIAREGRKFGLGLVLSSQRPSELSQTVLSQCNSFLLHRISNDRDQELVNKLVPDNLRGLLRDLPSLPSRHAILLGWASELPMLVQMRHLPKGERPESDDPDFWDVWSGKKERNVDWQAIADDWQQRDGSDATDDDGDVEDSDPDDGL